MMKVGYFKMERQEKKEWSFGFSLNICRLKQIRKEKNVRLRHNK
jgi:hypothetical protein